MKAIFYRILTGLGFLTRAPQEIGDQIEELKATPGGQRIVALDEKAGRLYARVHAVFWSAVALALAAIGYGATFITYGWVETAVLALAGAGGLYAAWCAVSHLRNPQAASEILVEELEDRVRPARWAFRTLRFFGSRESAAAE